MWVELKRRKKVRLMSLKRCYFVPPEVELEDKCLGVDAVELFDVIELEVRVVLLVGDESVVVLVNERCELVVFNAFSVEDENVAEVRERVAVVQVFCVKFALRHASKLLKLGLVRAASRSCCSWTYVKFGSNASILKVAVISMLEFMS